MDSEDGLSLLQTTANMAVVIHNTPTTRAVEPEPGAKAPRSFGGAGTGAKLIIFSGAGARATAEIYIDSGAGARAQPISGQPHSPGSMLKGLYSNDVLYEYPHVEEALRRLPQNVKDERNFRIVRALHHSMKKIYLPKEQWITLDQDRENGRYLEPYIEEVLREMKEQEEWNKQ